MSLGAQNMEMVADALGTAVKESGSAKLENGSRRARYRQKWVRERKTWKRELMPSVLSKRVREHKTWKQKPTPSVPPKMSPGAQNMKTWRDTLGIVENESGHAK
jgi:hypothetical protein